MPAHVAVSLLLVLFSPPVCEPLLHADTQELAPRQHSLLGQGSDQLHLLT